MKNIFSSSIINNDSIGEGGEILLKFIVITLLFYCKLKEF